MVRPLSFALFGVLFAFAGVAQAENIEVGGQNIPHASPSDVAKATAARLASFSPAVLGESACAEVSGAFIDALESEMRKAGLSSGAASEKAIYPILEKMQKPTCADNAEVDTGSAACRRSDQRGFSFASQSRSKSQLAVAHPISPFMKAEIEAEVLRLPKIAAHSAEAPERAADFTQMLGSGLEEALYSPLSSLGVEIGRDVRNIFHITVGADGRYSRKYQQFFTSKSELLLAGERRALRSDSGMREEAPSVHAELDSAVHALADMAESGMLARPDVQRAIAALHLKTRSPKADEALSFVKGILQNEWQSEKFRRLAVEKLREDDKEMRLEHRLPYLLISHGDAVMEGLDIDLVFNRMMDDIPGFRSVAQKSLPKKPRPFTDKEKENILKGFLLGSPDNIYYAHSLLKEHFDKKVKPRIQVGAIAIDYPSLLSFLQRTERQKTEALLHEIVAQDLTRQMREMKESDRENFLHGVYQIMEMASANFASDGTDEECAVLFMKDELLQMRPMHYPPGKGPAETPVMAPGTTPGK